MDVAKELLLLVSADWSRCRDAVGYFTELAHRLPDCQEKQQILEHFASDVAPITWISSVSHLLKRIMASS